MLGIYNSTQGVWSIRIVEHYWRLIKNDVSTSVIIMPATTPTPPIIPNRREMKGFVIVGTQIVFKTNYSKGRKVNVYIYSPQLFP